MKKSIFLALAAISMALVACQSKPASTGQSAGEQPAVENVAEAVEEAPQDSVDTPMKTTAEKAVETPAETPVDRPASAGVPVRGSEGNNVYLVEDKVLSNADACIKINLLLDKAEECDINVVLMISEGDRQIGVCRLQIPAGRSRAGYDICASLGGVFSALKPDTQYALSIMRVS